MRRRRDRMKGQAEDFPLVALKFHDGGGEGGKAAICFRSSFGRAGALGHDLARGWARGSNDERHDAAGTWMDVGGDKSNDAEDEKKKRRDAATRQQQKKTRQHGLGRQRRVDDVAAGRYGGKRGGARTRPSTWVAKVYNTNSIGCQ